MSDQNYHKEYLYILTYYENSTSLAYLRENKIVVNCRTVKDDKQKWKEFKWSDVSGSADTMKTVSQAREEGGRACLDCVKSPSN